VATLWDPAISAAPSSSTCSGLESGGKTCSTGSTSSEPDSHALARSKTVTRTPGPPSTLTVVKSRVPLVGYVVAPSTESRGLPSTSPRMFVAGPGDMTT
jgi:hypothetical protein